jgi:hypothetical protein
LNLAKQFFRIATNRIGIRHKHPRAYYPRPEAKAKDQNIRKSALIARCWTAFGGWREEVLRLR